MGRSNVSGETTFVMSEICMTSSLAATRGRIFFPNDVAARGDRRVVLREREDQRRNLFGETIGKVRCIGGKNLRNTFELRRGFGSGLYVRSGDQDMNIAAKTCDRGKRLGGCRCKFRARKLGKKKCRHQRTPASFLSLSTSSATLPTLTPAFRVGGSDVFKTLSRGLMSTPKSSGFFTSSGFFLAFMIFGSDG